MSWRCVRSAWGNEQLKEGLKVKLQRRESEGGYWDQLAKHVEQLCFLFYDKLKQHTVQTCTNETLQND